MSSRVAALSNRKLKSLKTASSGADFEWCMLDLADRQSVAIPVLKRKGGVLLALPQESFSLEELETGEVEAQLPDLGPFFFKDVLVEDGEGQTTTPVVYLDFQDSAFGKVKVMGRKPQWPNGVVYFLVGDDTALPDVEDLVAGAREWIGEGDARASDQYVSAFEGPPLPPQGVTPPVLDAVLSQLQNLAEAVSGLQADMGQVKQQAASSGAHVPEPAALDRVSRLAGRPPTTKATPTGTGLLARAEEVLASEGAVEEDEEPGLHMDTDQLLRLALVKMVTKTSKSSRRRKVGLGLEESSGSEAEEDPLRKLSGAKGTLLQEKLKLAMQSHPADYIQTVETLAASALGLSTVGEDTMERYVREELPVGSDRNMGHCLWVMLKAINLLKAKQVDAAHLLLLLGLASYEQFRLDQNWQAAWRITQLPLPPFQEWKVREGSLSQLRQDHAHSRLIHTTWSAAITARLKDEEVLVRRRGQYRTPGGQKGKGRGKNSEAEETQQ